MRVVVNQDASIVTLEKRMTQINGKNNKLQKTSFVTSSSDIFNSMPVIVCGSCVYAPRLFALLPPFFPRPHPILLPLSFSLALLRSRISNCVAKDKTAVSVTLSAFNFLALTHGGFRFSRWCVWRFNVKARRIQIAKDNICKNVSRLFRNHGIGPLQWHYVYFISLSPSYLVLPRSWNNPSQTTQTSRSRFRDDPRMSWGHRMSGRR